jgi:hypothetical protein
MQSFEPRMVCNATLSLVAEQRPTSWCTIGAAQKKADQMRMFRVIAVCFLAAPIGAQAQGVPRGMNYGAHRGAYTGYSVLGPVGGFVGGVVGGAAVESLEASTACSESILILTGITAVIGANPRRGKGEAGRARAGGALSSCALVAPSMSYRRWTTRGDGERNPQPSLMGGSDAPFF